jgi:hypothetical protein
MAIGHQYIPATFLIAEGTFLLANPVHSCPEQQGGNSGNYPHPTCSV